MRTELQPQLNDYRIACTPFTIIFLTVSPCLCSLDYSEMNTLHIKVAFLKNESEVGMVSIAHSCALH